MTFRSEQYNFFDEPARVFLMKASRYGLPVKGLHLFHGESATMQIKLASVLQVVDAKGPKMNQGETVTLFNDLCLMAPAALIEKERIQWEAAGPLAAQALVHTPGSHDQRAPVIQRGRRSDRFYLERPFPLCGR